MATRRLVGPPGSPVRSSAAKGREHPHVHMVGQEKFEHARVRRANQFLGGDSCIGGATRGCTLHGPPQHTAVLAAALHVVARRRKRGRGAN